MQGDFSIPVVDGNKAKSNSNSDPLLACQSRSYGHGLNIEQDGFIVDDIETEFVTGSAMEDAGVEVGGTCVRDDRNSTAFFMGTTLCLWCLSYQFS